VSLAHAEAEQGNVAVAFDLLAQSEPLLPEPSRGVLFGQRGLLLLRTGRAADSILVLDRAVRLLHSAGDAVNLSRALLNRGVAHLLTGGLPQARTDLFAAADCAREHHLMSVAVKAAQNLGFLEFLAGNLPLALQLLDEAMRSCRQQIPDYLPVITLDKCRVLLAAGLAEDSDRHLAQAIHDLQRQRLTEDLAEAELTRASAALLAERPEIAARWAISARRRFLRRGNQPWALLAALVHVRCRFAMAAAPLPLSRQAAEIADALDGCGLADDARMARLLAIRALLRAGQIIHAGQEAAKLGRLRTGDPLELQVLWHLTHAELAVATGRRAAQHRHVRTGLARLHLHRSQLGSLDLQTGAATHGRELATAALHSALAEGRPATVHAWAELVRAQAFRLTPVLPPDDPEAALALRELRHLRHALRTAELCRQPTAQLRTRRAELEQTVREHAWFLTGPGASTPPASMHGVADRLGRRVMVQYLQDSGRLAALVIASGSASLLDMGSFAVAVQLLHRLRADIEVLARHAMTPRMAAVVQGSAEWTCAKLAEILVNPLLPSAGDHDLVMVPTGHLYTAPWAQLPGCRGRAITVAPSATAWLKADQRLAEPDSLNGRPVLVAGPGIEHGEREVSAISAICPERVC